MTEHTHVHSTGGIRRGPRLADNFTILSNALINDERLSFRARAVLIWLLSKPHDWSIRSDAIAGQSPREGREAIRTAMRELAEHGYLVREKVQDELGRWSTIQTIYEEPRATGITPPDPTPRKSDSGSAADGKAGALTKDRSSSTETNDNDARTIAPPGAGTAQSTSLSSAAEGLDKTTHAVVDESHALVTTLEAATLAAGLPASYARIKVEQKREITAMIQIHGIDALVEAATRAHRPANPTMHVHGWIRLWRSLPVHRSLPRSSSCRKCVNGWVEDDEYEIVGRCECRRAA
ncbi:replication protein [Rhodococcus artemisiae]|uniref:Replication protein n=1 Tax=Rhodococcus artemisiae TaxID=714159 RepID=A0ABU7LCJ6_9NOCA|nr:replication protein [Rhodococcus artemisiae]MEE2059280.1 replication protein [Rhodococcus artemisiae]